MAQINVGATPRRSNRVVERAPDVRADSAVEVKRNETVKSSVLENACATLHGEIESLGSMLHDLERRVESVSRPVADDSDSGAVGQAALPACSVAVRNVYEATEKIRHLQSRVRVLTDHLDT